MNLENAFHFTARLRAYGWRSNIGTGRVIPLPPAADDTVATVKHPATKRLICVWPVAYAQRPELARVARLYGLRVVQYGRPKPKAA